MIYYSYKNGIWTLYIDEKKFTYSHIGVLYNKYDEGCSILKHGDLDEVHDCLMDMRIKFREAGLYDMASKMYIVNATKAKVDDINFVLDRTLIPEKYFKKLDVI